MTPLGVQYISDIMLTLAQPSLRVKWRQVPCTAGLFPTLLLPKFDEHHSAATTTRPQPTASIPSAIQQLTITTTTPPQQPQQQPVTLHKHHHASPLPLRSTGAGQHPDIQRQHQRRHSVRRLSPSCVPPISCDGNNSGPPRAHELARTHTESTIRMLSRAQCILDRACEDIPGDPIPIPIPIPNPNPSPSPSPPSLVTPWNASPALLLLLNNNYNRIPFSLPLLRDARLATPAHASTDTDTGPGSVVLLACHVYYALQYNAVRCDWGGGDTHDRQSHVHSSCLWRAP